MEQKKRIAYIDLAKLWAIFCVVWGHTYISGIKDMTDHLSVKFTWGFNMPLFMLLSGLFVNKVLILPFRRMLKDKILQFLLPPLLWSVIIFIFYFLRTGGNLDKSIAVWQGFINNWYWFMPSIFICFLLYYLSSKVLVNVKWGGGDAYRYS